MEIIGKYILDSKDSDYNNDIDTINFEEDGTFIFFYKYKLSIEKFALPY